MLLEVLQIREKEVRDTQGNPTPHPVTGDALKEDVLLEEAIDVNRIKSVRRFRRNGKKHQGIKGDICVIHLKDGERGKETRLHILYNYDQLIKDVNELKKGQAIGGKTPEAVSDQ